ncbi:RmlC-like jelly roll fold [Acididesulfobacillus acetoxydans]|uniref:RmlC-like jelly roll fold n=1 Tax=Acididesulfobacillus acetoxydans TaxID=1561005 RepID=A0A8S0Y0P6_9FIRM|nr:Crp/Fnr family transcriptional regulator [Acididesulfobacillus acetoxydans]CAA7603357.1 RmlC-like jelly roll fold [Acididesulfobacillus acetoxydans]CEJ09314.1 cAMP-binding protein [Acididesulfobacillus acetoxydans]
MDFNSALEQNPAVTVSTEESERFMRLAERMTFKAGETIFEEENSARFVYLIETGHIKIFRISPFGTIVTVGIRKSGDVIGIAEVLREMDRCCFAKTIEPSVLWKMDGNKFKELLCCRPQLALKIAATLSNRLREAETTILNLMTFEVDRRLARLLISLAEKGVSPGEKGLKLNIKLTQDEIATMIGTCRQTVTTTLHKFRDQKLIYSSKRNIEITDLENLKRFAGL